VPHEGAFCGEYTVAVLKLLELTVFLPDLMWSDPDDIDTWSVSPRGAGWLFGGRVTHEVSASHRVPRVQVLI
jgi:hypothetical protein